MIASGVGASRMACGRSTLPVFLLLGIFCQPADSGTTTPPCQLPFSEVYAQLSRSVVNVSATSVDPSLPAERVVRTQGSGFVVDGENHVVTSAHVVSGAGSLTIRTASGDTWKAELVGLDAVYDIAVLDLPDFAGSSLRPVRLATSRSLRPGAEVVILGYPLGMGLSISRGMVAAKDQIIPAVPFTLSEPMLQIDTSFNPGASGGPVADRCGDIVGVATSTAFAARSVSFAVPASVVAEVLPMLIEHGQVNRPWLGFHGQLIDIHFTRLFNLPLVPGLLVEMVEAGSPAEEIGLQGGFLDVSIQDIEYLLGGDIITAINGQPMVSEEALREAVRGLRVGDRVDLVLYRNGEFVEVSYELSIRPAFPTDFGEVQQVPVGNL